jgi:uncharacterized membrane protein YoaK (UPF0700 family)
MPIQYLSGLTAGSRSGRADLHIGVMLTVVAGALNAGGFLAIGQYTSHMTGIVSTLADEAVLGHYMLAAIAALSWFAFVAGAATTAVLVNYLRRAALRNPYAVPLLLEAMLILLFGAVGATLRKDELGDVTRAVVTLCFTMGLQNALITKISRAEIRTTHLTGLTTDMGIEIGKLLYWHGGGRDADVGALKPNLDKLRIHATLIGAFLAGGIGGALGFHYVGFLSTVPLALVLGTIALAPVASRTVSA